MNVKSLMNRWIFMTVIVLLGCYAPSFCQDNKDEIQYKKLEEKARKEFETSITKFESDSAKKKTVTSAGGLPTDLAQLVSSYDKFKDVTTVTIASPIYHRITPPLTGPIGRFTDQIADTDLLGTYVYSGQEPVIPSQVILTFKTFSNGSFFGNDPSFIVIADSVRLRLGNMVQTVQRFERSADEYVSIPIEYETFLKIANAEYVEVQIGNFDFPLSLGNLNALRRLVGLKGKERRPLLPITSQIANNLVPRVADTTWVNKDGVIVAFNMDGTLGTSVTSKWVQNGDVIRFEFPKNGALSVRTLGVGIVRGEYMVNRFAGKGFLGNVTSSETLRLKLNR